MADPEAGTIHFYSADPRGVIPLLGEHDGERGFHVPRSMRRVLRSGRFKLRADTAFTAVVKACAAPRPAEALSWIDQRIVSWYTMLHEAGHAHSIEAWAQNEAGRDHLVGGVYGVSLGAAFFGESMFCQPATRQADGSRHPLDGTGASKMCLLALLEHVRLCGYTLFDTQFWNEHIDQFGCEELAGSRYLALLDDAISREAAWGRFEGEKVVASLLP